MTTGEWCVLATFVGLSGMAMVAGYIEWRDRHDR